MYLFKYIKEKVNIVYIYIYIYIKKIFFETIAQQYEVCSWKSFFSDDTWLDIVLYNEITFRQTFKVVLYWIIGIYFWITLVSPYKNAITGHYYYFNQRPHSQS